MGNPFVHVELMSTNVGKAKAFYGKLFDWTLEDMDMGDMKYTMIKVGEGTGGGLMKNPMPNAGSLWVAYVNVDDLKAATAKAKSLGATVIKGSGRGKGGRLVQHHHRSDRSDAGPVAAERTLTAIGEH
jgi:uncharacterized protein